jgi:hypothetical protein
MTRWWGGLSWEKKAPWKEEKKGQVSFNMSGERERERERERSTPLINKKKKKKPCITQAERGEFVTFKLWAQFSNTF